MTYAVPLNPETIPTARTRAALAVARIWTTRDFDRGDRPALHPEHVFDTHAGIRLVIALEDLDGSGPALSVSASFQPGCRAERLAMAARDPVKSMLCQMVVSAAYVLGVPVGHLKLVTLMGDEKLPTWLGGWPVPGGIGQEIGFPADAAVDARPRVLAYLRGAGPRTPVADLDRNTVYFPDGVRLTFLLQEEWVRVTANVADRSIADEVAAGATDPPKALEQLVAQRVCETLNVARADLVVERPGPAPRWAVLWRKVQTANP